MNASTKLLDLLEQKNFKDMTPEEQFAVLTFGYSMKPVMPFKAYDSKNDSRFRKWITSCRWYQWYSENWHSKFYHLRWKISNHIPPFSWITTHQNKKWNSIRSRYLSKGLRQEEFHYVLYCSIFELLSRFVETTFPDLDPEDLRNSSYYEPFKEMQEIYDWWRLKGRYVLTGGLYRNRCHGKEDAYVPMGQKPLFREMKDGHWRNPDSFFPEFTSQMSEKLVFEQLDTEDAFRVETMLEMFGYMKRIIELSPYMESD